MDHNAYLRNSMFLQSCDYIKLIKRGTQIISFLRIVCFLFVKTWIPFTQEWFWRKRFLKFHQFILAISYHLPLKKGVVLHLNRLESPSPKYNLCSVWLKLALWFWRRFLNLIKVFFAIFLLSPLRNGGTLYLNKLESSSPKDTLC